MATPLRARPSTRVCGKNKPNAKRCTSWRKRGSLLLRRVSIALALASLSTVVLVIEVRTQPGSARPREAPARPLPVPTDVSPEMQALIGGALSAPIWNTAPKSPEEWGLLSAPSATPIWLVGLGLVELRERLNVISEPVTVNGAAAYMITPPDIPPENRNRLLVHVHGGCYVLSGGEAGTSEAIYMAASGTSRCYRSTTAGRRNSRIPRRWMMRWPCGRGR